MTGFVAGLVIVIPIMNVLRPVCPKPSPKDVLDVCAACGTHLWVEHGYWLKGARSFVGYLTQFSKI